MFKKTALFLKDGFPKGRRRTKKSQMDKFNKKVRGEVMEIKVRGNLLDILL